MVYPHFIFIKIDNKLTLKNLIPQAVSLLGVLAA